MSENDGKKTKTPTIFIQSQKINIRYLFRVSKCGSGLHVWIPPKLIAAFTLEAGDELFINIDEVRYDNLREVVEI